MFFYFVGKKIVILTHNCSKTVNLLYKVVVYCQKLRYYVVSYSVTLKFGIRICPVRTVFDVV